MLGTGFPKVDKESGMAEAVSPSESSRGKRKPRIERLLRKRGPLVHENPKRLLTLKGVKSSEVVNEVTNHTSNRLLH